MEDWQMKIISSILKSLVFLLMTVSSGMAMGADHEKSKEIDRGHQHKPMTSRPFHDASIKDEANKSEGPERPEIESSPSSSLLSQTEQAIMTNIPFFQPEPSLFSSEHWGISQAEVDYLFEHSSDYIGIATVNHFKKVNKKFQEATGWSEQELTEHHLSFFWHPDEVSKFTDNVAFAKKRLSTWGFELRKRCKDGSYIWIQWITLSKLTTPLVAFEALSSF